MNLISYLKIPYKHLGRDRKGCDCLGLVKLFYLQEFKIELPEYTDYEINWYLSDALRVTKSYKRFGFEKVTNPEYGDILLLNQSGYPKHLGVVINDGCVLHTTDSGTCCHTYLQGEYYKAIHSIFRYKGAAR